MIGLHGGQHSDLTKSGNIIRMDIFNMFNGIIKIHGPVDGPRFSVSIQRQPDGSVSNAVKSHLNPCPVGGDDFFFDFFPGPQGNGKSAAVRPVGIRL